MNVQNAEVYQDDSDHKMLVIMENEGDGEEEHADHEMYDFCHRQWSASSTASRKTTHHIHHYRPHPFHPQYHLLCHCHDFFAITTIAAVGPLFERAAVSLAFGGIADAGGVVVCEGMAGGGGAGVVEVCGIFACAGTTGGGGGGNFQFDMAGQSASSTANQLE